MGRRKKGSFEEKLDKKIYFQELELKESISKFYPDGVRVEFLNAAQKEQFLQSFPTHKRFSEDEQAHIKCLEMAINIYKESYDCTGFDFNSTEQKYEGECYHITDGRFRFVPMADDGIPVYLSANNREPFNAIVLMSSVNKEAYLIIRDGEGLSAAGDDLHKFTGDDCFVCLSEFDGIYLVNDYEGYGYIAPKYSGIMTRFSTGKRPSVERIYDINKPLTDNLFMPNTSKPTKKTTPSKK